ncbi:MAG TPA: citrate synthase [Candidatus Sumerlaeota bacterium]|nr:citrate synthase [Candidatus Sumerlaeota bacterium]
MSQTCTLKIHDKEYPLNMITGTENEVGIDIAKLRDTTGCITLDSGYGNTGSCESAITYIDGDQGILRYRGYPIEVLAERGVFSEVSYLLIFGELPTRRQAERWSELLTEHELLHESLQHHFEGFPPNAHPMAILSAMINASSCFYPEIMNLEEKRDFTRAAARLISQVRTIAAFSYKKSVGRPIVYPKPDNKYVENFLHMMFSVPYREYNMLPEVVKALRLILVLHADHEQNCSTSTVRMVGSSGANLYASAAAGVCALWGPRHGGANQAVLEMLESIQKQGLTVTQVIEKVKAREFKLMGFGHRIYKNYDPRAKILKKACDEMLNAMGIHDEQLEIAKQLEEAALQDPFFIERKLYPNVDFYSGIILKAIGIPLNMFTVMFAIGRMPGWVAHWYEVNCDPRTRIYRPRQIYQGSPLREYVPMDLRG